MNLRLLPTENEVDCFGNGKWTKRITQFDSSESILEMDIDAVAIWMCAYWKMMDLMPIKLPCNEIICTRKI